MYGGCQDVSKTVNTVSVRIFILPIFIIIIIIYFCKLATLQFINISIPESIREVVEFFHVQFMHMTGVKTDMIISYKMNFNKEQNSLIIK